MYMVEGRIFRDAALPSLAPKERAACYDAMNAAMARLHRVDVEAVGLADFGRPGNYFQRQISRWSRQYREEETEGRNDDLDAEIHRLGANTPPGDECALVPGDYGLLKHQNRQE